MAGDVIAYCPGTKADHPDWQKNFARQVGQTVWDTRLLSANDRSQEIESKVRSILAADNIL